MNIDITIQSSTSYRVI